MLAHHASHPLMTTHFNKQIIESLETTFALAHTNPRLIVFGTCRNQQDVPDKNLGQKRKSSGVKHIEKLEKGGHLYKSKESKPAKKPSLPPKSKEQEDFELLNRLSLVRDCFVILLKFLT